MITIYGTIASIINFFVVWYNLVPHHKTGHVKCNLTSAMTSKRV